jgi:hypothetical protein
MAEDEGGWDGWTRKDFSDWADKKIYPFRISIEVMDSPGGL